MVEFYTNSFVIRNLKKILTESIFFPTKNSLPDKIIQINISIYYFCSFNDQSYDKYFNGALSFILTGAY